MKVYSASFLKKDRSIREMLFARITDINEINPEFISNYITGTGIQKTLGDKQELVWDLEEDNFRIFNWGTLIGEVKTQEMPDEIFYK